MTLNAALFKIRNYGKKYNVKVNSSSFAHIGMEYILINVMLHN